ncbi:putative importin subunit beta-4 [Escovopsis weberi]|uniref:Putative importin subunit beta-4 n=1 Tax=Escovopsis weberi TaxID=150374 RepID=A0A0M8N754_ESCWE|nr:putative importin subunit beta-4 [Escovopsis weberi]
MDKDKLAQLLQASQVPNTEQVKAVTADLQKNYYSQPESLLLLIEIALTHGDAAVRQLASVQALRLVSKHWKRQPADKKPLVRSHLLEGTLKETSATNRHSLARLIAGIVGADMEQNEGEEYLKQLLPLNTSDNVIFREVGTFILYAMLEDDPAHFGDHTHQLLQLFQSRLDDQSKEVRMNIVRAIGAILMIVDPEEDPQALSAMQGFVPGLVNILKATVEAADEESYSIVFDVFHSFIAFDSSLLSLHLRDLLMFMIELAANTNAEDDPRSQALGFLIQAVRFRRMKIQGMKDVGAELMIKAMHIMIDLDSDDEEDMSPARVAISLIDQLASELPPRQVIVPLLEQFPAFATNPDPRYRMAAMLALGNAAEGAPDFISTQLQPLLPTILNLLCDSETAVRHAALVGLIHLAEEMADEMASHHSQIIEAVLKNLESASQTASEKNISIIRCACGALDTFGDGIDTKIMAQYGPSLIGPMVKLLEHEDFGVKAAAASAVGAIASSMEKDFQPYFEGVMKSLGNFVMLKDSEDAMNLRSSTCDSLGRIALAVGAEAFQPYVMDLMKASEEALGLENPRLKETTFILWSNLSKVYREQFDHFLGGVFQGIFASLELEEEELDIPGIDPSQIENGTIVVGGKRVKVKVPETEDDDADIASGDEDWDDIEDLQDDLTGVTAVAMEQEIALDVLGDVISNSCNSSNLEAFVEKTIEKVVPFTDHDYEGCRKTAISTLWRTYARVFQVWEEGAGVKWEAGLPPKPAPPASIQNIGATLHEATMTIWANDSDRSVVTDVNRNIAATLKGCGPAVLSSKDGMLQEVVSVVSLLITRSHPCQLDLGDEDEEQEVDAGSSEYDWLAIDTALDVVVGLAAALGPDFGELWKIFEKPVLKLASSTEDLHRSTAIGTIAEIIKYCGESITPYTISVGQALLRRLTDPDALTKSNAAYAIGLLVMNSTDTQKTIPMYPQLWEKLEPLLSLREMHVTDNVAGALSRMIIKNPDAGFVAQALPSIVATLPLQEEFEENEPIYRAIFTLYDQSNGTVQQLTPQLIGIFEKVLGPPEGQVEPETRQLLCQLVQMLYKNRPELLANNPGLLPLAGISQ